MYLDPAGAQINQPRLFDAMPSIQRQLRFSIIFRGGIRNFHDEKHVVRLGMARCVEVWTRPQYREIRLRLGVRAEMDRILDTEDDLVCGFQRQKEFQEAFDHRGTETSDRGHLNDLPFDQLDAVVFAENAGPGHLVVFGRCEFPSR